MVIAFAVAFIYVYMGNVEDISEENVGKMMDEGDRKHPKFQPKDDGKETAQND